MLFAAVVVDGALVRAKVENSTESRLRAGLNRLSKELVNAASEAAPLMKEAAAIMDTGICMYSGFCRSNPAASCEAVLAQEGVDGFTIPPDGKYWLAPTLADGSKPLLEINCLHTQAGGGWMQLFDDRDKELVQQYFDPTVEQIRVTEILAFTVAGPRSSEGSQAYLYNVDVSILEHDNYRDVGRTMSSIMNTPWVGQDGDGRKTNFNITGISLYPHSTHHNRFKYISRPSLTYGDTLMVLDDGDIGPDYCRTYAPQSAIGTCYNDGAGSLFPQTCYDARGLISFGCSDSVDRFVHGCGSCSYRGYGPNANRMRSTMVNRIYVR